MFAAWLCACGSATQAKPPALADLAPLPPVATTAEGVLVEHRDDLQLTRDQVDALNAIDAQHRAANDPLEAELDQIETTHVAGSAAAGSRAGRGGGRHRGGGGGASAPAPAKPSAISEEEQKRKQARADRAKELHAQLLANDRTALAAALGVLAAVQVEDARRILGSAGFELP